jgi:hypothetical protein
MVIRYEQKCRESEITTITEPRYYSLYIFNLENSSELSYRSMCNQIPPRWQTVYSKYSHLDHN